ncbi:uncharacterized protein B0H18DRAFT_1018963 [Fomitopsis serialis]|uniref:uncharacterized protein n=1 Tax=Fomitopsis serialis TaxID=139415 RepID=UPI002007EE2E|nr:uncharacterized protein B0H18DRAFT_1018963 [Neoantrodia serialis]KAH9922063.1 hypothetical protein B0H18DRAFT_1018963 [Neoantrodia serialis]
MRTMMRRTPSGSLAMRGTVFLSRSRVLASSEGTSTDPSQAPMASKAASPSLTIRGRDDIPSRAGGGTFMERTSRRCRRRNVPVASDRRVFIH